MDTVKTAKLKQLQNRKMDAVKSVTDICEGVVLQKTKGGAYIKPSHCSVMEAFLDECEPEEVDRNYPITMKI